jgi:phospholipase/carboxylesterase
MSAADSRLVTSGSALGLTGLIHRVREPAGPGPHPAVVMLHGRSGDENAMWVFAPVLPAGWLLVSPRGLKPDPDGGHAWHPRKRDEWPRLESFDEAVAAVARLIRALPEVYGADPGRVYLMGFSQGAATAYALALRHRELVGGVAGLVGFVPEGCGEQTPGVSSLSGLPIFMAVGRFDPLIPLERARASAEALRRAGAALELHEYPSGHRLNPQGVRDLRKWWWQRG